MGLRPRAHGSHRCASFRDGDGDADGDDEGEVMVVELLAMVRVQDTGGVLGVELR